jgi:hypothetical protein
LINQAPVPTKTAASLRPDRSMMSATGIETCNVGGIDKNGIEWTGGAPTDSSRMGSTRNKPETLLFTRLSGKDGIQMYTNQIKGNDNKFKKNYSSGLIIQAFSNEVNLKLVNNRMESVLYIPDNNNNMMNIITDHAKFTMQQVQDTVERSLLHGSYDEFDEYNLAESKMYLLNSIDFTTKQEINPFMTEDTSGTELWMLINGTIQSSTIEQLTKVDDLI